jgi:hypothetical protein
MLSKTLATWVTCSYVSPRFVCTWAEDERPADLHMAQPNVPVSLWKFLNRSLQHCSIGAMETKGYFTSKHQYEVLFS